MDLNKIVLREVLTEEVDALRQISIETFTDQFGPDNNPEDFDTYIEEAFNRNRLLRELEDPECIFYFAEWEGNNIAYLKLNTGKAQTDIGEETAMEIERIYVRKEFQGHKLGALLMDKAVTEATQRGFEYLWLGVWEHNPRAISFYERKGFKAFGTHPYAIGKDIQNDILMRITISNPK